MKKKIINHSKPSPQSSFNNNFNKIDTFYGKRNFIILFAGIAFLAAGLIIMANDKQPYGYGLAGITIGPLVFLAGLIIPFFSIFIKQK